MFAANILLAVAWVMLTGELTTANLLVGFVLGFGALWLVDDAMGADSPTAHYVQRVPKIGRFILYFFWSILAANWVMARAVLSPLRRLEPAIVAIPLEVKKIESITFLANWITLTPGTLSLEISEDTRTLYIHTFQINGNIDQFRREIKDDFERRVIEVFE